MDVLNSYVVTSEGDIMNLFALINAIFVVYKQLLRHNKSCTIVVQLVVLYGLNKLDIKNQQILWDLEKSQAFEFSKSQFWLSNYYTGPKVQLKGIYYKRSICLLHQFLTEKHW